MAKEPKGHGAAPTPAAVAPSGYETFDGDEAGRYIAVGGRCCSIVRRYPDNPYKPGKRYRFVETKAELDRLVEQDKEVG